MLIGYAQVSTVDQNPDHQIDALPRDGVAREGIHVDTASGAKASRPKLDLVLPLLREGDTLKVTRLDRLSRSVLHLVTLGADLHGSVHENGVRVGGRRRAVAAAVRAGDTLRGSVIHSPRHGQ